MTDIEIWKDIKDYEGLSQVSNLGRVKSLGNGRTYKTSRIRKLYKNKYGYLQVQLCKDGKRKWFRVNRLVATAFLDNPEGKTEVNHIDEDKTNNRVDNLKWEWHKDNINHGTRNERVSKAMTNGKLSKPVLQLSLSGDLIREWPSVAECGRNGFNIGHVAACCRGEEKTHKGFRWMYKE